MAAILYGLLSWVLRKVVIQLVVYLVLYGFISVAVSFLTPYLFSGDNGINSALNGISGQITIQGQQISFVAMTYYLLNYFLIPQWLEVVLAAYATVFLIRRIPFIG